MKSFKKLPSSLRQMQAAHVNALKQEDAYSRDVVAPRRRSPTSDWLIEARQDTRTLEQRIRDGHENAKSLDEQNRPLRALPNDVTPNQYRQHLIWFYGSIEAVPPRFHKQLLLAEQTERKTKQAEALEERIGMRLAQGNFSSVERRLLDRALHLAPAYTLPRILTIIGKEFSNLSTVTTLADYIPTHFEKRGIAAATYDLTTYDPPSLSQVPTRHRRYSVDVHVRRWDPTTQTYKV